MLFQQEAHNLLLLETNYGTKGSSPIEHKVLGIAILIGHSDSLSEKCWVVDSLLLNHVVQPQVVVVTFQLVNFFSLMGRGDHPKTFVIWWPMWLLCPNNWIFWFFDLVGTLGQDLGLVGTEDWGLGLGLDNYEATLHFHFQSPSPIPIPIPVPVAWQFFVWVIH